MTKTDKLQLNTDYMPLTIPEERHRLEIVLSNLFFNTAIVYINLTQ